jgi:hypothetical protein
MTTDFKIISGTTVPSDYTWDQGTPLTPEAGGSVNIAPTTQYIFGYAPALRVKFANLSIPNPTIANITYTWDFGDYYHDTTNSFALTSLDSVEHIFVMPGKYTVQLRAEETTLETDQPKTADDLKCLGKHDVRWFWNALTLDSQDAITWNQTRCVLQDNSITEDDRRPKWWFNEDECLGKYCRQWSWYNLSVEGSALPIKWRETRTDAAYEKRWQYEANEIECEPAAAVAPFKEIVRKPFIVEVAEKPPVAGITCITRPLTGTSPFTVELSPKGSRSGSFPIDRIDWDFGDGSPIVTVTRYTQNNFDNVFKKYPLALPDDPDDVRNYNVKHTYIVDRTTYPIFYPSLTCYSANTNTSDSCSTVVGPIIADYQPTDIHVFKVRNTRNGNIYAFNINQNLTFYSTNTNLSLQQTPVVPTAPRAPLRDTFFAPGYTFTGNPGNDYLNSPEILLT